MNQVCILSLVFLVCTIFFGCADGASVNNFNRIGIESDYRPIPVSAVAEKALNESWWTQARILDLGNAIVFYHGRCVKDDRIRVPYGAHTVSRWSGCIRGEFIAVMHGRIVVGTDLNIGKGRMNFDSPKGVRNRFDIIRREDGGFKKLKRTDIEAELRWIASNL